MHRRTFLAASVTAAAIAAFPLHAIAQNASLTTILSAHEKNVPVTIVGEAYLNSPPASAFMVLKDSPIQTGKDFNGKLVPSATIGDIGTIALSAWVDQHGWATTKDYSAKHPDIVRAFVRAYGEAVTYTNAHHAETIPLIAAYTTIDPAIIARMTRVAAWPTVTVAHLQPLIDACVKYGFLKARFPAIDVIDVNAR